MQYSADTNIRSVFTQILSGEIPGVILFTTERFFAILTNKPTQPGHTLLIPKRCGVQFSEFKPDELQEYALAKQFIIRALEKVYCTSDNGVKIGHHVSGFEIRNHYHEHFIPAQKGTQVTLQGASEVTIEQRKVEAEKISPILERLKSKYIDSIPGLAVNSI